MERESSSIDHRNEILSSIRKLKCDGKLCDVTIKAGDIEFGAHKVILTAASEYFEAMFRSQFSEQSSGIVTFPNMKPEIARSCIEFIYSGEFNISEDNVSNVIDAAEMLDLPSLSKLCVKFLAENVSIETCAYVISLSHRYAKEKLDLPLQNFLLERFDELVMNKDFLSLENDAMVYCLNLLHGGGSELEMQKWTVILMWVNHSFDARKKNFPRLFETLDISCFSKDFMKHKILQEPLIQSSAGSLLAIARHYVDDRTDFTPPRKRKAPMSHIVVSKPKQYSQVIVKYSVNMRKWSVIATFPGALDELVDFVAHDDRLFVGTGHKLYEYTNNIWRSGRASHGVNKMFSSCASSCICENSCPLHTTPSCYNRCIVIDISLFMLTTQSLYELNIVTSKISDRSVALDLGNDFFITASDEKIYAFGGEGTEKHAIQIDLKTRSRVRLCNMNLPKSSGHAFWYDEKVYTFGGDTYPASIEYYLPNQDMWLCVSGMQISRPPVHIYLSDDKLELINGTYPVKIVTTSLHRLHRRFQRTEDTLGKSICCPSSC